MGLLILPERRTRQPRGLAPIDWGNPITRGLVFLMVPSVGNGNLIAGDPTRLLTPVNGVGRQGKRSDAYGTVSTAANVGTVKFSFLTLFVTGPTLDATQTVICRGGDEDNQGFALAATHSQTAYSGAIYMGAAYNIIGKPTGGPLVGNTEYCIGGSYDGTNGWGYNNGVLTIGPTAASLINTTPRLVINRTSSSTTAPTTPFGHYFNAVYSRVLSDAEFAILSANPWQLFAPEPRRLWLGVAAAGTTVTCTVGAASAVGVSSQVNSTLQAGVAAASAAGVTALASSTLQTTVGAAAATGVNAQASVTLQASVAAAGATGVTALLNASVSASVGAAGATGVTAQTAATISAGPGNASATGVNALLPVTAACGPGNAAATGVNAVISVAGSTTIVCTVGAASAAGVAAFVNTTLQTAVGAASAQGVAASTNVTLTAAVGDASAVGVTAMGNVSILASIGNASATGVTAVINLAGSATVVCTVGSASALGVAALLNATLTTSTGDASAVGITANFQSGNLYQPSRFIGYVPFASRIGYVQASKRTGYVPAK